MAKIISVSIQKGGSGKTTTSISISSYLASIGKKVLLVDLDAQCNSTSVLFNGNYQELPRNSTIASMLDDDFFHSGDLEKIIFKTKRENLYIIPAHSDLSSADVELSAKFSSEQRLTRILERIHEQFDFIIIDCPPNLGRLPINAYIASDFVLIPVSPNIFDFDGLQKLVDTIQKISVLNRKQIVILGILVTKYDITTTISKEIYSALKNKYNELLFNAKIPRNTDLEKANLFRQDIFSYLPTSVGAVAYASFVEKEFLPRLKNYEK